MIRNGSKRFNIISTAYVNVYYSNSVNLDSFGDELPYEPREYAKFYNKITR